MKVFMITGDRRFCPGNPRFELQKSAVEELVVVYWGRGAASIPDARGFDVVTAQDPFWRGCVAWMAARKAKARLNIQVHADLSGQSFVKHVLAQIVLRHADSIRVVSGKIKQQVLAVAPRARVAVLPVFIDIEPFKNIERIPHDTKTVLWLGRFESEKNPFEALNIIRRISNAKLVMLGAGSLEAALKEKAQDLPVEFPGWQDPKPFLARADVVLCTSRHESFGASIVEALAAGVAVVAPDVGVAKEAGAIVVPYMGLSDAARKALDEGSRGELKLKLPSAEEWKTQWRKLL